MNKTAVLKQSRSPSVNAEPLECYNAAGPALLHRRSAREGQKAMDVLKILRQQAEVLVHGSALFRASREYGKEKASDTRLTRRMKSCFSVQERIISATVFINWSPVYLQVSRVTAGLRLGETNACHDSLSLPGSRPSSRLLEYAGIQGLIV